MTLFISFRSFFHIRYVTILTLVRVRTEQTGTYTLLITNEDDVKEVTFALDVQGKNFLLFKEWLRYIFKSHIFFFVFP